MQPLFLQQNLKQVWQSSKCGVDMKLSHSLDEELRHSTIEATHHLVEVKYAVRTW